MAYLKLNAWGSEHEIALKISKYANNGNLAIQMLVNDGYEEDSYFVPWGMITTNFGNKKDKLPADIGYVDTNNMPYIEKWITDNKLGVATGSVRLSGYCIYPQYKFDLDKIKEFELQYNG